MPDQQSRQPRRPDGEKADIDALSHGDLAEAIVGHITSLPPGSVISVQGSWGRGKTDVVTRVFDWFTEEAEAGRAPEPIWVDPWQYGRPDLIQPVVLRLMERMGKQNQVNDKLKMVARSLLHASNDMVFKAVSTFVPFGPIIGAAQPKIDDIIDGLLNNATQSPDADADPVHEMAKRFSELVGVVVGSQDQDTARLPLLICVDDLDRCLPDHQIAMLEAIFFLTSPDAHCSFLVALDPVLVQQAARTHYHTDGFDSNQYLDKLFQLRVNLTALQPDKIEAIVDAELKLPLGDPAEGVLLKGLAAGPEKMKAAFGGVFAVPELTNPRLVHRVFERLRLAAAANSRQKPRFPAGSRPPGGPCRLVRCRGTVVAAAPGAAGLSGREVAGEPRRHLRVVRVLGRRRGGGGRADQGGHAGGGGGRHQSGCPARPPAQPRRIRKCTHDAVRRYGHFPADR